MKQCIIQLSQNNGEVVNCLADESGNRGLGLNESGITWNEENSPVRLEIAHDEVQITRIDSDVEAVLERNGRTLNLKKDKSVRVLSNDEIRIGASRFSVHRIFKGTSEKIKSALKSLRGAGTAAMIVMAASLMLPVLGCESDETPDGGRVPEVEAGSPMAEPCLDKTGQELKSCCEALDNESRRAVCCERLANEGSGLKCESDVEIPEVLEGELMPPACYDKSGKELKACCEALDNDYERADCCERLAHEGSGLKCEEKVVVPEQPGGVPMPPPLCSDKTGKELKACCEAIDDQNDRAECCERLATEKSGLKCEVEIIVPEETGGVIAIPVCYEKTGKTLKACCEALDAGSERDACCARLEKEKSGFVCFKDGEEM